MPYWHGNIAKYLSSNRLIRFAVYKFLRDINEIVQLTNSHQILDVGCGEGFVSRYLKEHNRNASIQGLDISREALRISREFKPRFDLIRASAYNIPLKSNSSDLVICCELLEHLIDPENAVKELKRVSKSQVLITVPRDPFFRIANILRLKYLRRCGSTPGHIRNWTEKRFMKFLQKYFDEVFLKTSTVWIIALCR